MEVNEATFESEVIESCVPVLVDFYGVWCPPCRQIAPLVDKLAKEHEGKLKVAKVNVDENSTLSAKYQVSAIPALLFFKNGIVVDQYLGVQKEAVLQEAIERLS